MKRVLWAFLLLTACTTLSPRAHLESIIADPTAFNGKTVRTCGWETAPDMSGGRHLTPPMLRTEDGQGLVLQAARNGPSRPQLAMHDGARYLDLRRRGGGRVRHRALTLAARGAMSLDA